MHPSIQILKDSSVANLGFVVLGLVTCGFFRGFRSLIFDFKEVSIMYGPVILYSFYISMHLLMTIGSR